MQWNDGYSENVLCFTNNIPQRDGGTHLTGLRAAMTRVINKYIEDNDWRKRPRSRSPATTCAKAFAAWSGQGARAKFWSQTKDKLVSSEVRGPVEDS